MPTYHINSENTSAVDYKNVSFPREGAKNVYFVMNIIIYNYIDHVHNPAGLEAYMYP
jgi:hypothetical protein